MLWDLLFEEIASPVFCEPGVPVVVQEFNASAGPKWRWLRNDFREKSSFMEFPPI